MAASRIVAQAHAMPAARVVLLLSVLASACAAPPPMGCSAAVGSTGRGIPVCTAMGHVPVCDAPGEMARFGGPSTTTLEGGTLALCDSSNQLVCGDRTVLPHCLLVPPEEE